MIVRKMTWCGLAAVFSSACFGQTLTMLDAIHMAKQNNGNLKAAYYDLVAAKARKNQASAAFLPVITPSAEWVDAYQQVKSGPALSNTGTTTQASLIWQPLDAGQRAAGLRAADESVSAQMASTLQTLRQLIFDVESQFLNTLRAQELEKVADAEQDRANKVLDQTKTRVDVGDAARREILQAQADALNAKVGSLNARNRTNTNSAILKAQIGLQNDYKKPELQPVTFESQNDLPTDVASAVEMGLRNRQDLIARRRSVASQAQSLKISEIQAGLTWSLDFNFTQQFSPNSLNNRNTSFFVSYPLFDGGKSRAIVEQGRAGLFASKAILDQAEKDARSEIEAAFLVYQQDQQALDAASLALKAARSNYEAADGSQKAGAASLLDVITANVSLVTAESNYIEANYDLLIAQLKLRLVTGLSMPGEDNG